MADSEEPSLTANPLAGEDNYTFELATFSSPRVRRSGTPTLHFFEAVFFVLSAAGICTSNVEPIQQQLYVNFYFRSNAQVGVNGFSYLIL